MRGNRKTASVALALLLGLLTGCDTGSAAPVGGTQAPGAGTPTPGVWDQSPGVLTPAPGVVTPVPGVVTPVPAVSPGTVTGVAVDGQGRPLEGVHLWIETEGVWATPYRATTGPDGRYTIGQLSEFSIYKAYAWLEHSYDGQDWCLRMANTDDAGYEPFAGATGAVRDFRWLVEGPMPDSIQDPTQGGPAFGAVVRLFTTFEDGNYEREVEFRLTPQGPLIDGSEGQPLTRTIDLAETMFLNDIPVGTYTVTASTVEPDGSRTALRVGADEASASEEGELRFQAADFSFGCGSASTMNGVDRAFFYVVGP